MKIEIEYCNEWNYLPTASSLAAELKEKYNVEPQLISSSGGVFEIQLDGKLIFSKKQLGRFPEDNEIQEMIDSHSFF